jgi:hypothetical protein
MKRIKACVTNVCFSSLDFAKNKEEKLKHSEATDLIEELFINFNLVFIHCAFITGCRLPWHTNGRLD